MSSLLIKHDNSFFSRSFKISGSKSESNRLLVLKSIYQNLTIENNLYTLTITPNLDGRSFEAINTNGSQRGGRPILHYLPTRVENIEILSGQELQPVIADDFLLIPNHLAKSNQENLQVQFRASPVR